MEGERERTYQPVSPRAWARERTADSQARAAPVAPPVDAGCTWRSVSSWRGENIRSLRSVAWLKNICKNKMSYNEYYTEVFLFFKFLQS